MFIEKILNKQFKIIFVVGVIVLGGLVSGGYYWWTGTPEYSIGQIKKAIETHNQDLGLKYIDTDAIVENLWIDMKSELMSDTSGADGFEIFGTMLGLQLAENMKPVLKEQVQQGVGSWFSVPAEEEKATEVKEDLEKSGSEFGTIWQKNLKIKKLDNSAYIELSDNIKIIFTKKAGERYWVISKIEGFTDTLSEKTDTTKDTEEAYVKDIKLTVHPSEEMVNDYQVKFGKKIGAMDYIQEGNFQIYALLMPVQWRILSVYHNCLEKRCNDEEIIKEMQELFSYLGKKLYFEVGVRFVGGQFNYDKLSIPDNFENYIFLENDKGDFLRPLNFETKNLSSDEANWLNEEVSFRVDFPETYEKDGVEKSLLEGKYIKVVINGLGFNNNSIKYELPLSGLFADAPTEIKQLFSDFGF